MNSVWVFSMILAKWVVRKGIWLLVVSVMWLAREVSMDSEQLSLLEPFLSDFGHDDIQIRLNAIRNLTVFTQVNPDLAFQFFLPTITSTTCRHLALTRVELLEDEDEVLCALAEELGTLSASLKEGNVIHIFDLLEVGNPQIRLIYLVYGQI